MKNVSKILSSIIAFVMVIAFFAPSYSKAADNILEKDIVVQEKGNIAQVEKYVEVLEDGTIKLSSVPTLLYQKYQLDKLEERFADLNSRVLTGEITINKDLSIVNNTVQPSAVYGSWTEHWWGIDRNFTNSQAIEFADYAYNVSKGFAAASIMYAWVPAWIVTSMASSLYWGQVSDRIKANNNGNGVYMAVTWVGVFNIEPL